MNILFFFFPPFINDLFYLLFEEILITIVLTFHSFSDSVVYPSTVRIPGMSYACIIESYYKFKFPHHILYSHIISLFVLRWLSLIISTQVFRIVRTNIADITLTRELQACSMN